MSDLRVIERKKQVWRWAGWALMVLAPWLQLAAMSLVLGKNAFATYPVWSDELDYWRNLYNLIHVGMPKGYSGVWESVPSVGMLSVHGITPLLLYGGFTSLFGLGYHSILLFNALWISLAALVFCAAVKPKPMLSLTLTGMLMVFVPAILYCATSMTEQFNYAVLLFFLAFILRRHKTGSKWALFFAWLTTIVACLYRITYLVLFIPLVWEAGDKRFGKKFLLNGVVAVAISLGLWAFTNMVSAPYPASFLYNWFREGNINTAISMFLSHAKANLYDYFIRPTASPMQDAMHWLYTASTVLCLLASFVRTEKKDGFQLRLGMDWLSFGCFLMLFLPFAMVIMFYETNDWADFRTLAPFVWGVAAMLMANRRKVVPGFIMLGSITMLVWLCMTPPVGMFEDEYRFTPAPYSDELALVCQTLAYTPDAEDPWLNTIRTDMNTLQVLTEVPPGMGLMYGWFTPENTGKSHWILTDHLKIVVEGYEPVATVRGAKVYRKVQE